MNVHYFHGLYSVYCIACLVYALFQFENLMSVGKSEKKIEPRKMTSI